MINNKILLLLFHLRKDKLVTINYLSETLNLSKTTIKKHLNILIENNFPVIIYGGRYGGVKLVEELALTKLLLTENERKIILNVLEKIKIDNEIELLEFKKIINKFLL